MKIASLLVAVPLLGLLSACGSNDAPATQQTDASANCHPDAASPGPCADVHCEAWEVCNPDTGACELRHGKCNGADDCLSGYTCDTKSHQCKPVNQCRIDDDCAAGKICQMSQCVDDPKFVSTCSQDSDCWTNKIKRACVSGKCAVRDCSADEYACAYNTNGRISCNDKGECEEPASAGQAVKDTVLSVMSKLKWTKYTNKKYVYDVESGVLFLDCSFYVKQILRRVSRQHYDELPKSSSSGTTALAKDYYQFFTDLATAHASSSLWKPVSGIEQVQPGDIIAYAYSDSHAGDTTGHVMIILSKSTKSTCTDSDQSWVWITDAARSGHFEDTRNDEGAYASRFDYTALLGSSGKPSGVGIGKMYFRTDKGNTYYRWSSCAGEKHEISIAIGRLVLP